MHKVHKVHKDLQVMLEVEDQQVHKAHKELKEFLGLKDQREALARNLSYGDQRRLEIGIALASRARRKTKRGRYAPATAGLGCSKK